MKFVPIYDKEYYPMIVKLNEFKKEVALSNKKPIKICVERNKGYNFIYNLEIFADASKNEENYGVAERLIKTILWVAGGYKIYISGDKYVYENMVQNGHRIGGEQSGHIIFTKYATTGDGILTSLKLMEAMLARKKKMSELAAPVVFYPQVLKNIRVKCKADCMNDPDVLAADAAAKKALGDKGRTLLRESGTEPVVRVMAEAPSEEECEKYVDQIIDVIRAKGHIVE
jgi:phosphomannomutase